MMPPFEPLRYMPANQVICYLYVSRLRDLLSYVGHVLFNPCTAFEKWKWVSRQVSRTSYSIRTAAIVKLPMIKSNY